MRFAIAAGGTAGHINPALALAEELVARGHEVEFIGTPRGLEATLVPQAGFAFVPVEASGFDRSRPWTAVSALAKVRKGTSLLRRRFRENPVDVVVGFGAYVEVAAARAAHALKIPLVLHEQNSVPGMANKMVARYAHTVALAYPAAREHFAGSLGAQTRVVVTGNPVRSSVLSSDRARGRELVGVPQDATMLLVFGGSLGAQHINQAIARLKDALLSHPNLYVVHSAGKQGFEQVCADLALTEEEQRRWKVYPYIDQMGDVLKAADCVVSRAGATSVAEISALEVPALLVPYPYARGDHQTKNAAYLVDAHAALMVPDADLDAPVFAETVFELVDSEKARDSLRAAARELTGEGATVKLADLVERAR